VTDFREAVERGAASDCADSDDRDGRRAWRSFPWRSAAARQAARFRRPMAIVILMRLDDVNPVEHVCAANALPAVRTSGTQGVRDDSRLQPKPGVQSPAPIQSLLAALPALAICDAEGVPISLLILRS
jgi:hypothetical protein